MFQGRTIFSWYANATSAARDYSGRIHRLDDVSSYGQGSINLTNIRNSDQGWYECKVIFPNRTPSSRNNGTWLHLSIDGMFIKRWRRRKKKFFFISSQYLIIFIQSNCVGEIRNFHFIVSCLYNNCWIVFVQ